MPPMWCIPGCVTAVYTQVVHTRGVTGVYTQVVYTRGVRGVPWGIYPGCERDTCWVYTTRVYAGYVHPGIYVLVYTPGYTQHSPVRPPVCTSPTRPSTVLEGQPGLREGETRGWRGEWGLELLILLGLMGECAQSYSSSPARTDERSDRRRDSAHITPMVTVMLRRVVPSSGHPINGGMMHRGVFVRHGFYTFRHLWGAQAALCRVSATLLFGVDNSAQTPHRVHNLGWE